MILSVKMQMLSDWWVERKVFTREVAGLSVNFGASLLCSYHGRKECGDPGSRQIVQIPECKSPLNAQCNPVCVLGRPQI